MRRKWIIPIVAISLIAGFGGAAFALVTDAGGSMTRRIVRTEVAASVSSSTAYVTVVGANVGVSVPTGASRLILARFTAESQCTGGAAGNWCSMRIIATNTATGAITELNPASGLDFAFDSVATS